MTCHSSPTNDGADDSEKTLYLHRATSLTPHTFFSLTDTMPAYKYSPKPVSSLGMSLDWTLS